MLETRARTAPGRPHADPHPQSSRREQEGRVPRFVEKGGPDPGTAGAASDFLRTLRPCLLARVLLVYRSAVSATGPSADRVA